MADDEGRPKRGSDPDELIVRVVAAQAQALGMTVQPESISLRDLMSATSLSNTLLEGRSKRWFDLLSDDPMLVFKCANELNLTSVDFLEYVITRMRPPNRDALRWEQSWFRSVTDKLDAEGQVKVMQVELAKKRKADTRAARETVALDLNDVKHAHNRSASASIPALWQELAAQGKNKTDAAKVIAAQVNLAESTVRKKLQKL